jgi:prepilin-type N-terminal cleavage/methylation domain-containing protein
LNASSWEAVAISARARVCAAPARQEIFAMQSNRIRSRAGFTLVEILAVVVILGIASAIIIPNMGTRDDMRVAAAARVVVADLIYAQNQAISTGKWVYVKFDTANNKYTLLSTASSGGDVSLTNPVTQTTYFQQFGASVRGWEQVSISSAVFNGTDATFRPMYTIAFDEIGSPYVFNYTNNQTNDLQDGGVVITAGQFSTTVTVQPATGEINVN